MIWPIVSGSATFQEAEIALPRRTVGAVLDGVFQQALLDLHTGKHDVFSALRDGTWQLPPAPDGIWHWPGLTASAGILCHLPPANFLLRCS